MVLMKSVMAVVTLLSDHLRRRLLTIDLFNLLVIT